MLSMAIRSGIAVACFVYLLTTAAFPVEETSAEISPWCDPGQIDPFSDDVAAFLNADLMALTSAAQIAYDAGDYQAAAKYYLAIIRCDVHDVIAMFDLACCYAMLDRPELSAVFLKHSVARGFENLERIQEEPAFSGVRKTAVFQEAMGEIVTDIEDRRATKRFYYATARYDESDPASVYEMACCYAVRDDARMAAEYLLMAFAAGYSDMGAVEKNSEFDSIRETDEFQATLRAIEELKQKSDDMLPAVEQGIPPETVFCEAEVALPCLIQFPADYDPEREYPLVIGLHGYGGSVERFASLWFAMDDPQFIYAVPEAPYPVPQQQYLGFSWWVWDYENKPLWDRTVDYARDFTRRLTDQLQSEYNICETYLLGFSQGTALAYSVGISDYPSYAGVVAVGGWLDEAWFNDGVVSNAQDMHVMIAHAEDDQSMRFTAGEQARDMLTTAGYDVKFLPYQGGHTLTEDLLLEIESWIESR